VQKRSTIALDSAIAADAAADVDHIPTKPFVFAELRQTVRTAVEME
jgi:hypothetical protein